MKRIITISFFLFAAFVLYSQQADSCFRLKQYIANDLSGLDGPTYYLVFKIEQNLNEYKKGKPIHNIDEDNDIIQTIRTNLSAEKPAALINTNMPKNSIKEWLKKWKVVQESICTDCYASELNYYIAKQKQLFEQKRIAQQIDDSLKKVKADKIAEEKKKDPFKSKKFETDTSYNARISLLLAPFGRNKRDMTFTTFCGVRVNFAMGKIGWYLQEDMGMMDKDFNVNGNKLSITYVPRVSSSTQKEYITITYTITKNKYNNDEDKKVITSCDITGTSELILKLFVHYWANLLKIDETKTGEVAYYNYIADRVALIRNGRTYKIEIKQIGDGFDYEMVGK